MGEFDDLLRRLRVRHHWGSPYHPQSTGQAERTNGLVINRLRRWHTDDGRLEWDRYLQAATLAINARRSARLRYSPMEALFGRQAKMPLESGALQLAVQDFAAHFASAEATTEEEHADRLRLLGVLRDDALRVTDEVNDAMVRRYAARRSLNANKLHTYCVGEKVWMRTRTDRAKGRKLLHRWQGPGIIIWLGDLGAAKVQDVRGKVRRFNVDDLKPYLG